MNKLEKIIVSHNAVLNATMCMVDSLDQNSTDVKNLRSLIEKHEKDTRQAKHATLETRTIVSRKNGTEYPKVEIQFPAEPEKIGRSDIQQRIDNLNAETDYPTWRFWEGNGTWSANRNTETLLFASNLVESYNKTVDGAIVDPISN